MTPAPLTYRELVTRYGMDMAFDLLLVIEKMAKIKNSIQETDEEARLQRALQALDQANDAA